MAGFPDTLKGFYYALEDRYYEALDRANEFVPVYSIIDPIDKIVPSFLLFLLFLLLLLLLLGGSYFAGDPLGLGGLLGIGAGPAKFRVIDSSSKALGSVAVSLSTLGNQEVKTSDSFGEFQTTFYGRGVSVSAKQKGFKDFSDKIDIAPGKKYTVKLVPASSLLAKKIDFEIADGDGERLDLGTDVSMDFSCSSGPSPSGFTKKGPSQSVSVQGNCGSLTTVVNAPGFDEARKTVDVAAQQGIVRIAMNMKQLYGKIQALVFDDDTSKPIAGAELTLKSDNRAILRIGSTDATGAAIADHVPIGRYYVEAVPADDSGYPVGESDDFDIGIADVTSGSPKKVEVALRKSADSKKILLKFVDSASKAAIKGVKATLVIASKPSFDRASGDDGTSEFVNLDSKKSYAAIASHPDYVLKVIKSVPLIPSTDSTATVVELLKSVPSGPGANSGIARAVVAEFSGGPVANANTWLYSSEYGFPLNGSVAVQTGQNGVAEYRNLPAGNYRATAQKILQGGLTIEGSSSTKSLGAGQSVELPITLVTANGSLQVKVLDHGGRAGIADANVIFVDRATGRAVANSKTSGSGITPAVEFKADARVFIIAEKEGYYRTASVDYGVVPRATTTIEVVLDRIGSGSLSGDFDVGFVDVYGKDGAKVTRLDANTDYRFRFKAHAMRLSEGAKVIVRTGLDSELAADAGKIFVKSLSPSGFVTQAAFSACYNPASIYSDCPPLDPAGGSKQVVASFGTLDPALAQDYEFEAIASIRAGVADETPIELRYGGTAKVDGTDIFVVSQSELKILRFFLGRSFCTDDCAIRFEAAFQDVDKKFLASPVNANLSLSNGIWVSGQGSPFGLVRGVNYKVDFNAYNDMRENFSGVILDARNYNSAFPLAIQTPQIQIGAFPQGAVAGGSVTFTAQTNSEGAGLDLNLGLNKKGSVASIAFRVLEDKGLAVSLLPNNLPAGKSPVSFDVNVSDSGRAQIGGADIFIFEHGTGSQITAVPSGAKTGPNGIANITLERPDGFAAGTILDVNARKTGYRQTGAPLTIAGGGGVVLLAGIECITDGEGEPLDSKYIYIGGRNGSESFTVKNSGCGRAVDLNFSKHPQSDISISYLNAPDPMDGTRHLSLGDNVSANVALKAGNVLGVQPLYITVKMQSSSGAQERFNAGTLRAVVTNAQTANGRKAAVGDLCLSVRRPAKAGEDAKDGFTFNFEKSTKDALVITNRCFSGLADTQESSNPAGSWLLLPQTAMPRELAVGSIEYAVDAAGGQATQSLELTKTGATPQFFIITQQDYVRGGG